LGVDGGGAVAERIAAFVREHGAGYDRILASQDWHRGDTDNGGHFAVPPASPDFTDTWPVHCVAGTDGAALHEAVAAVQERVEIVHKGHGVPSYSVLEGTVGDTGEPVQQRLEGGDGARSDGEGVAYDCCGSGRVHKAYGVRACGVLGGTVVDAGGPVQQLLEGGDWARIDVVGLAYDFCVRATALGAREVGAPVRVLREMTAAVHPEGVAALEE